MKNRLVYILVAILAFIAGGYLFELLQKIF